MIHLDDTELRDLRKSGIKVVDAQTGAVARPAPKPAPPPPDAVTQLVQKIDQLLSRPQATPSTPPPPQIVVQPARVEIPPHPVPAAPVRQWKFTLTKDSRGHTTEIIATAIE